LPGYEFNKEESKIINATAIRCLTEGTLIVMMGIVKIVIGISLVSPIPIAASIVQAIIFIAMGLVFFPPFISLRKVAVTEGSDIPELMKGMRKLSMLFLFLVVFVVGSILCDLILILLA
jgi:hypothetical protein